LLPRAQQLLLECVDLQHRRVGLLLKRRKLLEHSDPLLQLLQPKRVDAEASTSSAVPLELLRRLRLLLLLLLLHPERVVLLLLLLQQGGGGGRLVELRVEHEGGLGERRAWRRSLVHRWGRSPLQ
jgi:hypothetical protein